MSFEFDKEIDSLLREGARHGRATLFAGREKGEAEMRGDGVVAAETSVAHLDADEQNAFAENALPAATRHAYSAHLADCDDCRRSVTQLALAAGIPAQLEMGETSTREKVLPKATWRERVGLLFAQGGSWRYAVPALALLLVSAVTLMVLTRSSQRDASIAQQRNTTQPSKPVIAKTEETHHAPQDGSVVAVHEDGGAANSNAPASNEGLVAKTTREGEAQPVAGGALSKDTAPAAAGAAAPSAPSAATAVSVAPPPTPISSEAIIGELATKTRAAESVAEQARVENRQTQNEIYQRDEANTIARRNEPRRSGPSRGNNIEQAPQNARGANTGATRNNSDKKDEDTQPTPMPAPAPPAATSSAPERRAARQREAERDDDEVKSSDTSAKPKSKGSPEPSGETRNVAGRKFRRQDGAWIDTSYASGQATTVVRRNSEQYRALIADEPTLRRVADSLGGEVVIVWKGRAYRIK